MAAPLRTPKKLLLGKEIKHMISAAGVTQAEAGSYIEVGQSRIAQLIDGKGTITVGDLIVLAERLGFNEPGYLDTLRDLRRDNTKRGHWRTGYLRAYSEDLRLRIAIEAEASLIRDCEVEIIPGLIQCESYVRALYQGVELDSNGVSVDDRVEARVKRQDIYKKTPDVEVHFIMSESCIRRVYGDAAVMREQLDSIIELSKRSNVLIQLVPFNSPVGRRANIARPFTLLRVPSPGVAGPLELAYTEGEGELRYSDDTATLTAYDNAWSRLTAGALSFEETRAFLRAAAADFG